MVGMTDADPIDAAIGAMFPDCAITKSRGGYTLADPRSDTPLARIRPIQKSDRFELLYWSMTTERWRTFGDFGRLSLTLDRVHEIFRAEPIFHI